MRVLITGSNGFLGQHLVKHIKAKRPEWEISGFDLHDKSVLQYSYKKLDFNSKNNWKEIINDINPDCIFHLAGLFRGTEQQMFQTNVHSFERFIEGIRDSKSDPRLVVMGSAAQYGLVDKNDNPINETHPTKPVNTYGITKNQQEEIALKFHEDYDMNTVCTRPSSFIGKGISPNLLIGVLTNKFSSSIGTVEVEISRPNDVRDYLDIRDTCQALILLQELNNISGEIFNLSSNSILTNLELVTSYEEVSGKNVSITYSDPSSTPSVVFLDSTKFREISGFKQQYSIEDSISWCLE